MKELILSLLLLVTSAVIVQARDVQKKRRDAVLNDKKHFDIDSYWVYDDFEKAQAEAQKIGKPLLVVFRCLPCEACHSFDEHWTTTQLLGYLASRHKSGEMAPMEFLRGGQRYRV